MLKKLALLALAVGALVAFAAPAVAQANVELTNGEEETLAVGSGVTATSSNLVTTLEGGGQLECKTVTLHLEVKKNGLNHVVLKQLGEATAVECFLNIGIKLPATITDGTLGFGEGNEITFDTWGTAKTTGRFGADVPAAGLTCVQTGTVHAVATNGTDILHVNPSVLTPTGENCRKGTIEGAFTLEQSGGGEVVVDAVNTT